METDEPGPPTEVDSTNIVEINRICRLCGNQHEKMIAIYGDDGLLNDLPNKIKLYLPIKVAANDKLPLQCCWGCATTLITWHDLVLTVVETDQRLQNEQLLNEKLAIPDEDLEKSQMGHSSAILEMIVPSDLNVSCQTAPNVKKSRATRKTYKEDPSETLELYLGNIEESFITEDSTSDLLGADFKIEHVKKNDSTSDEDLDNDKDKSVFSCHHCQAIFVLEQDVGNHIVKEHPGCEIIMSSLVQDVVKREKSKSNRRKNNKIDQDMINSAKVIVNERVYYNCKECGKSLHSPYTYIWHMRIHTGERPYVCDLCGKQFRVSQGLVRHLRETHQGIKKFPCDLCGRMFATRRNVEEHRRIHTNERPYICDLCGKAFKQKASLFVHKRSHKNYFPFKCAYCNQEFRTKPPLLVHITRHTGEKPYKCETCGRCFRIKYELKRHRLIHSDEKPFTCTVCAVSFRQKRYLRNHMKSNHSVVWINCDESIESNQEFSGTPPPFDSDSNDSKVVIDSKRPHENFDDVANLESLICIKCDCLLFKNRTLLKEHVFKVHHIKWERKRRRKAEICYGFMCDLCDKGFTRKFDMEKHKKTSHKNELIHLPVVSERSKNREILQKCKIQEADGNYVYKCDECSRHFKQSYNLMRHRTIHTGLKEYFCHMCAKRFRMATTLARHITDYHQRIKNYGCDECGKRFSARSARDEHMNTHTNNRPYICDQCGKAFRQKASLHIHKMFHTNVFKFKCETCGKKFRRAQDLKIHGWLHTGHKPHSCAQCGTAFRLTQDLRKHSRTHDKTRECSCPICGSLFKQERYLKVHMKIHEVNPT